MVMRSDYVYRLLTVALILVCSVYFLTIDWSQSKADNTQNRDAQFDSKYSHDKDTVEWVKKNLHRPSGQPLKLSSAGKPRARLPKGVQDWSQFAQMEEIIDKFLKHKKNGRFLEVGAHDGEFLSNSLVLEKYYNWTGLLVEPSAGAFSKLLAKNRNAYALKACLSNVYKQQSMKMDSFGLGVRMSGGKGGAASIECVPLSDKRHFLQRFMTAVGYVEAEYFELDFIYVRKDLFEAMKLEKVNGVVRAA